ncbi:MAG: GNAT family N-acetyltransferase [Burkholderiaceae bacterium]
MDGVLRQATRADIAAMHRVRLAVHENKLLSNIVEDDYVAEIEVTGRGWVITEAQYVVAFSVGNRETRNVWALFVHPEHERKGYGRRLHATMVDWLFGQGVQSIWLSTEPASRARQFYEAAGWSFCRIRPNGEHHYELQRPNTTGHVSG